MKKLIIWAVLALIIEIGSVAALNNFVFVNSLDFKSNEMNVKLDTSKEINTVIEEGADDIRLSYQGRYLTYYKDNKLYIQNTKTGSSSQVLSDNSKEIMYYKWLDKRNLMAVVEKVKSEGKEKIQLVTYNPSNSSETFVQEICTYEKNMKVENMTLSILTNVYYIHINKGGLKNVVYRIDRNNYLDKVDIKAHNLGNIQTIPHEDRLIYEDKVDNKFFITSPDEEITFNTNKNLTLLGIDSEDIVYMGELDGDKISGVLYGKISEDTSAWKWKAFDFSVSRKDLFFNKNSEIVVNDRLKGSIINLTSGIETEYEGDFIDVKDDFIAVMNNERRLVFKNLNN